MDWWFKFSLCLMCARNGYQQHLNTINTNHINETNKSTDFKQLLDSQTKQD
jgi:hypothetical protein